MRKYWMNGTILRCSNVDGHVYGVMVEPVGPSGKPETDEDRFILALLEEDDPNPIGKD